MKRLVIISGISASLLALLFLTTDPRTLQSFLLVFPFVLLAILLFNIFQLGLQFLNVSQSRSRQVAITGSVIPTLLLLFQSIGQLTLRDVGTVALLTGLSFFYVSRLTNQKTA